MIGLEGGDEKRTKQKLSSGKLTDISFSGARVRKIEGVGAATLFECQCIHSCATSRSCHGTSMALAVANGKVDSSKPCGREWLASITETLRYLQVKLKRVYRTRG